MRHLGDKISVVQGIIPQNQSGDGAVSSAAAITRDKNYEEGEVLCQLGAVTGTPTSFTVTYKLQHKELAGDAWVDEGQTKILSAANAIGKLDIDMKALKSLIQVVATVAFTGGTTPTVDLGSSIVYGEAKIV